MVICHTASIAPASILVHVNVATFMIATKKKSTGPAVSGTQPDASAREVGQVRGTEGALHLCQPLLFELFGCKRLLFCLTTV
jgi:hypothetical protein